MLEAIVIISFLALIFILVWPRRRPYGQRGARSYNGQGYGRQRELY